MGGGLGGKSVSFYGTIFLVSSYSSFFRVIFFAFVRLDKADLPLLTLKVSCILEEPRVLFIIFTAFEIF